MPKEKTRIFISHLLPDEEMKKLVISTGAGIESIEFSVQENLDSLSRHIRDYKARLEYDRSSWSDPSRPFSGSESYEL